MEFKVTAEPIDELTVDTIVLSAFSEERPLKGSSGLIDWRTCGRLSRMIMDRDFGAERFETLLFPSEGRLRPVKVLIIGLGSRADYDFEAYSEVMAYTIQSVANMHVFDFAIPLPGVGLAGLDYSLATKRLIEEVLFKYRDHKERLDDLKVTIVAGSHRLREIGAVLNKHARSQRDGS